MCKLKEPLSDGYVVAGYEILGHTEMVRECKKNMPNGTPSKWKVVYYIYEAECQRCGGISSITSNGILKRISDNTKKCRKCTGGTPSKYPKKTKKSTSIDDLMGKPGSIASLKECELDHL
jgi:hypothetical protein